MVRAAGRTGGDKIRSELQKTLTFSGNKPKAKWQMTKCLEPCARFYNNIQKLIDKINM